MPFRAGLPWLRFSDRLSLKGALSHTPLGDVLQPELEVLLGGEGGILHLCKEQCQAEFFWQWKTRGRPPRTGRDSWNGLPVGTSFVKVALLQMKRILIIEDDRDIVELVRYNLANEGFQVSAASDGSIGLAQVRKSPPDLLLLDLMLPKLSGLEICKEIRRDETLNRLPILMLTARGDEADRVVGLEIGADDYVTKPFSPRELVARVKALLRRAEPPSEAARTIEAGRLVIDPSSYRVTSAGKPVTVSTLEFRLLYYLASRPNRVFTRDQLLDAVWGSDRFVTPRSVDVYIRRLREKIEADPENPVHLKTVRGAGYLFETGPERSRGPRAS